MTGEAPGHYDLLHVEHLRGGLYGTGVNVPKVWDAVDCITHLFEQAAQHSRSSFGKLASRLELPRTRACESRLLHSYDHVLATSARDRDALLRLSNGTGPCAPITVIPNGVDLAYFSPMGLTREPATLIITGKMSYHANVTAVLHFCGEVLPLIRSQRPDVKLLIVGKDPAAGIARLAADPAIAVTGYVPDLRPYLARATLAVSPVLYGAGCQNKVLEAMAMGTPVVSTSVSTWGIKVEPDRDLLVADSPRDMADDVLELLSDSSKRQRLSEQARKTVETHHDWNAVVRRLEGVYDSLRDSQPAGHGSVERE
jgi:glycosyltransferase involved in cell wall biosynthesis